MIVDDMQWFRFTLRLHPPVRHAGTTLTHRHGYLLRLTTDTGLAAWGEAAPFPEEDHRGPGDACNRARLTGLIKGQAVASLPFGLLRRYPLPSGVSRAFLFAAEQAVDRIRALAAGKPLHRFLNPAAPDRLPLCALLDGSPAAVRGLAEQASARGMTAVKIKVGRTGVDEEINLVRALRKRLPLPCRIRLDANRAWDWDTALKFARAVRDISPDYLEEPLADPSLLPRFAVCTEMPYAVDETLADQWSAAQQADIDAAAAWLRHAFGHAACAVWKPMVVPVPENMRMERVPPLTLSGAYESGVGTSAILALSAACGGDVRPPGVDTYSRLTQDVLRSRLNLSEPFTLVPAAEQQAAAIDPARLEALPDAC